MLPRTPGKPGLIMLKSFIINNAEIQPEKSQTLKPHQQGPWILHVIVAFLLELSLWQSPCSCPVPGRSSSLRFCSHVPIAPHKGHRVPLGAPS